MKTIGKYIFAILGWLLAAIAFYWGLNRCSNKEANLSEKLAQVQLVKQNPVGTFVDSSGREHVKYRDGSVAKLPSSPQQQKLYKFLRDSIASTIEYLIDDKSGTKITEVSRLSTQTTGTVKKEQLDSLPYKRSIRLDPWMILYADNAGGFSYKLDDSLNRVEYTEPSGLFGLVKRPYISFYSSNPNARIMGFEQYKYPVPLYKPRFKIYAEADYNITLKNPSTDLGTSIRIGNFEVGAFGRLDYNIKNTTVLPSYGARIRYNIVEQ